MCATRSCCRPRTWWPATRRSCRRSPARSGRRTSWRLPNTSGRVRMTSAQGSISAADADEAKRGPSYLAEGYTIWSWLSTRDHKRIALLYGVSITLFFFLGGVAAALIRLQLLSPQGTLVTPDTYNKLFTAHGVIMVWLFLIPSIPSVLGNFLMPMMIGARDLAFPRLNLTSWYLYMAGVLVIMYALLVGGVDTGWTFYTPFSSMFSNSHVVLCLVGVLVVGFSSILTGLNFIVTVHTMRAVGMGWFRLPLF